MGDYEKTGVSVMKKVALILTVVLMFLAQISLAGADSVFILCQPDSWVNVRNSPNRQGTVIGRFEIGDELETDGRMKHGFLHLVNLSLEDTEGWIHAGFVTEYPVKVYQVKTEIVSRGRVACRRAINGTRRKWLKDGMKITVYAYSTEWAVTDRGFVKTDYIGGL